MADDSDPAPAGQPSDFGQVYSSGDEALEHGSPGENAPPIPEAEQGRGEGYVPGVTQSYTREELMQKSMDSTKEARDILAKIQNTTTPMWDKYRSMLEQDQQSRQQMDQQMVDSLQQQQQQQMPQAKKNDFLSAFGTMMAVVVPIALAFGMRGNGFAKGAMLAGLGEAIKNFVAGRQKAGQEDMKAFNEQAKAIKESNRERMQIYGKILADRKMELDDQFKMIHSVAQEFWDPYMAKAAAEKNMTAVQKQMDNQYKANDRFSRGVAHANKKVDPNWTAYRNFVIGKSRAEGKVVDPDTDPDAADKVIPYKQWYDQHSKDQSKDEKDQANKEATDPDAPPSDDELAKMRSKVLD
jgi:hypothetical protein